MQVLLQLGLGTGTLLLRPSVKYQGRPRSEAGRSCKSPGKASGCREARPWAIGMGSKHRPCPSPPVSCSSRPFSASFFEAFPNDPLRSCCRLCEAPASFCPPAVSWVPILKPPSLSPRLQVDFPAASAASVSP